MVMVFFEVGGELEWREASFYGKFLVMAGERRVMSDRGKGEFRKDERESPHLRKKQNKKKKRLRWGRWLRLLFPDKQRW